jgi:hypothetical protein
MILMSVAIRRVEANFMACPLVDRRFERHRGARRTPLLPP